MGITLTNQTISNTYDSLLKLTDNDALDGTLKTITDGLGNDTGLAVNNTGDLTVSNSITTPLIQLSGGTGTQGQISWNADEETLDLINNGATLQLGQEMHVHVRNNSATVAIPNGTPVYVTGTLGASGRLKVAPMIADGSVAAEYFMGITTEEIEGGGDGKVTWFGKVRGIDTTPYGEGAILYVSTTVAGAFQTSHPTAPNLKLEVAFTINSSVNGTIFVRGNNGNYLDELHDVEITSVADKDLLVYNSSNQRWENSKAIGDLTVGGDLTVLGNTTYINTSNVTVKDGLVLLANDNVADIIDIGLYGKYNDGTVKYTGLYRDATDGIFKIFDGLATEPTTIVGGGNLSRLMTGGLYNYNQADFYLETYSVFFRDGAANPNQFIQINTDVALHSISFQGTTPARLNVAGAYDLEFATNNTVRMSIDSAGDVAINNDLSAENGSFSSVTASNAITSGTFNVADAIIHTGDTDTMIEFLANQIKTTTGGVLNINTTPTKTTFYQNVGIGDTPRGTLDLTGDGIYLGYSSADANERDWLISTNYAAYGDFVIRQSNAKDGNPYSAGTTRLTIDSAGRVGIGATPTTIFQVTGSGATINFGDFGNSIQFNRQGINYVNALQPSAELWIESTVNQIYKAGTLHAFYTGGSERMRIDSSGRVGIGITPNEVLDLKAASGDTRIRLDAVAGSDTEIKFFNDGAAQYTIGHDDATDNFVIGLANVDAPLVSVTKAGNVGAGTQSITNFTNITNITAGGASGGMFTSQVGGTDGLRLYSNASGTVVNETRNLYLALSTNNTERMRIDSVGILGLGTQSASSYAFNDDARLVVANPTLNSTISIVSGSTKSGYIAFADGTTGTDRYSGQIEYNHSTNDMMFKTNGGAERARITSGGYLLSGTQDETPNGVAAGASFVGLNDGTRYAGHFAADATTSRSVVVFSNPNGQVGYIELNGITTSYVSVSDYRLKENVVPMTGSLDRIDLLNPSRFNFISEPDKTIDGFLAHEVQKVVPEAVTGEKDAIQEYEVTPAEYETVIIQEAVGATYDEEGNELTPAQEAITEQVLVSEAVIGTRPVYQGIDSSKIVPLLTAGLQEANAIIKSQAARITELEKLEARIAALEAR